VRVALEAGMTALLLLAPPVTAKAGILESTGIGAGVGAVVAGPPGAVVGGFIGDEIGGRDIVTHDRRYYKGNRSCWRDDIGYRQCWMR
jgi:hypothetical protein